MTARRKRRWEHENPRGGGRTEVPGKLEMREFPLPEIGEEDGILKLEMVGVCGSDPGIFKGKSARGARPYPIILGHEMVGRVYQDGPGGPEAPRGQGRRPGHHRVRLWLRQVQPLPGGALHPVPKLLHLRIHDLLRRAAPSCIGAYADYLYIHPRAMLHKISEELSAEAAVLTCAVLGNGVRWLHQIGGCGIGKAVAIVGPGQQGLAGVSVAKESGAGPIMVVGLERDAPRLEMAVRFGADVVINADRQDPVEAVRRATGGAMAQVVMDVTGHPQGARLALDLAGLGATLVLPGIYGSGVEIPLILDKVVFNEITLKGVFSHDYPAVWSRPSRSPSRASIPWRSWSPTACLWRRPCTP